jgi:hypothetical protein
MCNIAFINIVIILCGAIIFIGREKKEKEARVLGLGPYATLLSMFNFAGKDFPAKAIRNILKYHVIVFI